MFQNDESKISYCDAACRSLQLSKSIPLFVSLLSNDDKVIENRQLDDLPAISIKWDKPFTQASRIISVLDEIMVDDYYKLNNIVIVSENSLYKNSGKHYFLIIFIF